MKELIPKDEYGIFADTHDTARVNMLPKSLSPNLGSVKILAPKTESIVI